jgi:virulence-associated protein VapD
MKTNDNHERLLSRLYKQHVEMLKNPKIHFVDFDVTQEIGYLNNEQYTAMNKVFSRISDISQQFGFFLADGSTLINYNNDNNKISMNDISHQWKILRQQNGVIRANCKDNVDRTSLVQTFLTLQILKEQMRSVGIDHLSQGIFSFSFFE